MNNIKPCRKCGKILNPPPSRWQRADYICNACHQAYCKPRGYKGGKMPRSYHRAYEREYLADPKNRARRAANMKRYRNDPKLRQKHEARWILNRAVASKRIIKGECEGCGSPKTQAHHHDYSKPLDVRWLCMPCHRIEHAKAEGR